MFESSQYSFGEYQFVLRAVKYDNIEMSLQCGLDWLQSIVERYLRLLRI